MSRLRWVGFALALCMQQAAADSSGFIEDMPRLTQDPDRAGAMIWQKSGVDRAYYKSVMIEPITIFISPDSEYQGLNADELKAISDGFRAAITKALAPEVPVVTQGGPGVLYVRAAITNVMVTKAKRGFFEMTAQDAAGQHISLKHAVLEIETYDPITGVRLGVLIDKAPETGEDETLSWDSINKTFAYYAERFKLRMQ